MSKFAKHWIAALLLATGASIQVGCQACGSCYDYSPPVANCQCNSCDCGHGGRAGSRMSSFAQNENDTAFDESIEVAQQPAEEGGLLVR